MENRAAVFTSSSQDVEIYRAGAWWSGSLLGWRHESDGSCRMWVRAVVAGVERTEWTGLGDVRLPERAALRPVPTGGEVGRDALPGTVSLVAVRDPAKDPSDPAAGPSADAGGVADPASGARRTGGRRRAPETAEEPTWAAAGRPAGASGRHRAPATADDAAGRHRAADTGAFPPVRTGDDQPAGPGRTAPPLRTRRPDGTRTSGPTAPGHRRSVPVVPEPAGAADDGEFHTRPLRLASSVPRPRSPHGEG
jgi:hypothetical protein